MPEFPAESLRAAVDESIRLNPHLLDVDAGLVAAARAVADRVDVAVASESGPELTKALYLVPHVTNLLREMLATPAARVSAKTKREDQSAKSAKLTALRGGKSARGGNASGVHAAGA